MTIDHTVLGTHINTDPNGRGYPVHITAGSDHLIADLLNLPRSSNQINRGLIPSVEVVREFDDAEFDSLTNGEVRKLGVITATSEVDASNANIKATLAKIFSGKPVTLAALQAIAKRDGSDIEDLFAPGDRVSVSDVGLALRGPPVIQVEPA